MNGIAIEKVETFDFLGVTLDTDKGVLSKYSGIINKLKNICNSIFWRCYAGALK